MKKCIALVLAIVMCLSLMTVTAFADDDVITGNYGDAEWTLDSTGVLTLGVPANKIPTTDWDWSVPEAWSKDVKELVVKEGILGIPDGTFTGCSMENVNLPDSLLFIGDSAFSDCESLKQVVVPENVDYIGEAVFANCTSLEMVAFPNKITRITAKTFYNCTALKTITIPEGLTHIDDKAFEGCSNLDTIALTDSLKYIGKNAFEKCTSLKSVFIPEGVTKVCDNAFSNCVSLRDVYLPSTLSYIDFNTFSGCDNLANIYLPEKDRFIYLYIGEKCAKLSSDGSVLYAGPSGATSYAIPDSVNMIADEAFVFCPNLEEIYIHKNVTYIDDFAFCESAGLTNVVFEGTEEEWNNIYKGEGNEFLLEAEIDYVGSEQTQPLEIVTQPASVEVVSGETAVFTVEATGEGLTYQWQFKTTTAGTDWRDCTSTTTGYNTAAISVNAIEDRSGYQYRCIITDEHNESVITDEVTLTVTAPEVVPNTITIYTQPTDMEGVSGNSVIFTVVAMDEDEDEILNYQWQFKKPGNSWKDCSTTTGFNTPKLIVETNGRDGYQYRCVISNTKGNSITSDEVTLTVVAAESNNSGMLLMTMSAPAIVLTAQPVSVNTAAGSTAVFSVAAEGNDLSYQWQYKTTNGSTWKNSTSVTVGYNTPVLNVQATNARNGYSYRCVITDANGNTVTSNAAKLTIGAAIVINSQPTGATAAIGETAVFSVGAAGNGLSYQWQYKTTTGSWKNSTSATVGYNTAELSVEATAKRDGYSYRCIITDANGNKLTSAVAVLDVQ